MEFREESRDVSSVSKRNKKQAESVFSKEKVFTSGVKSSERPYKFKSSGVNVDKIMHCFYNERQQLRYFTAIWWSLWDHQMAVN